MNEWLRSLLACPRHKGPLELQQGSHLSCTEGCRYPVVRGVPVLLMGDVDQTLWVAKASLERSHDSAGDDPYFVDSLGISQADRDEVQRLLREPRGQEIDPVVSHLVVATCGNAYRHLKGRLREYPVPELRLPEGKGDVLLDLGCNWGRWTLAASRKGYRTIGIDPSLGAVMAARRVASELGLDAQFIVGDARHLPLRNDCIDVAFSYSVLQHLSKDDAVEALKQVKRVLKPAGRSLIQMPTRVGIRTLYQQARRGFRVPTGFEVRYWGVRELRRTFEENIGPTDMTVDCYFGIGLQYSDIRLMTGVPKMVVTASEVLRRASERVPAMRWVADSLYLESRKDWQRTQTDAVGYFSPSERQAASRPSLLVVASAFYPSVGGYESVARFLAEGFNRNYSVTLLTETPATGGDETFPFQVLRNPTPETVRNLARSAEIVLLNSLSLRFFRMLIPLRGKLVIVHHTAYDERSTLRTRLLERLKRSLSSLMRLNICVSHFVASRIPGSKVVIQNPYDETMFGPGVGDRIRAVLFVGRLTHDKGADMLIDAFAAVHLRRPDWRVTVIGDGPERAALEMLIVARGLSEVVRLVGAGGREHVAAEMKRHPILAVPSRREAFGIVALEGLASGCRVVHSDAGGLPEAVGGFGISFPVGSVDGLAAALLKAIDQADGGSDTPVVQGMSDFLDQHSRPRVMARYSAVIGDQIADREGRASA